MKYITLIIGLLVMGCGKENPPVVTKKIKSVKAPAKELTKEDIVGSYTLMGLSSWVFHENGKREFFSQAGRKMGEGKWKLVENEVHTDSNFGQNVYRIEPNGDMTFIAGIDKEGKREELPNGSQMTWEKIKSKPVKELTLREKVVGEYEMRNPNQGREGKDTVKLVLLGTGNIEATAFGKTGGGTWKMVGNEVHVAQEGKSIAVFKIEPNGDLTMIAEIIRTKRTDYPKEAQMTLKKIK